MIRNERHTKLVVNSNWEGKKKEATSQNVTSSRSYPKNKANSNYEMQDSETKMYQVNTHIQTDHPFFSCSS